MDVPELPLRDWHEPTAAGWWLLAPGWWILILSSILILAAALWLWRRLTRLTVKKLARKQIECLKQDPDLCDSDRIRRLSILIRRICLSVYPRSEIARLTGKDWLKFLEKTLDEPAFSEGPGQVLIDAPYRQDAGVDCDSLFKLCERWIETLPEIPVDSNFKKAGRIG